MLDEFTNIVSKLRKAYAPSPWQAWAEQRQAARIAWYDEHTRGRDAEEENELESEVKDVCRQ